MKLQILGKTLIPGVANKVGGQRRGFILSTATQIKKFGAVMTISRGLSWTLDTSVLPFRKLVQHSQPRNRTCGNAPVCSFHFQRVWGYLANNM